MRDTLPQLHKGLEMTNRNALHEALDKAINDLAWYIGIDVHKSPEVVSAFKTLREVMLQRVVTCITRIKP